MWKGCGDCKGKDSKDCYACKTDYCNEEKHVYKQCVDGIYEYSYHRNSPKTCKNKYEEDCFAEIIENNKGSLTEFSVLNLHSCSSKKGLW